MAAVQETGNLGKVPARAVVVPRPPEGTGEPKLLERSRGGSLGQAFQPSCTTKEVWRPGIPSNRVERYGA